MSQLAIASKYFLIKNLFKLAKFIHTNENFKFSFFNIKGILNKLQYKALRSYALFYVGFNQKNLISQ